MRGQEMLDLMTDLDPAYIEAAAQKPRVRKPVWHRWAAMAACFCLLLAVAAVTPQLFRKPVVTPPDIADPTNQTDPVQSEGPEQTEPHRDPWTAYYNEAATMTDAYRPFIQAIFTEDLDEAELEALKPGLWFEDMTYSGYAVFDNRGTLLDVIMEVHTSIPVTVFVTDYSFGTCYGLSGDAVVSVCEGVEFALYQYVFENTVTLSADASFNDLYFTFTLDTTQDQLEQDKAAFQRVLECFAHYGDGKPDLSAITPDEIPELTDLVFSSLKEAQTEPDFGGYLPAELPAGFEESAIRRLRFQNANYLSAMWSRGMENLSWIIRPFAPEDAGRCTTVQELENYDLSLYPIPRADSVPDELYEVVHNPIFEAEELTLEAVYRRAYKVSDAGDTDGWRMNFSVRYGDVIVSVSAKGVEPEWVYDQLKNLNMG